MSLNSYDFKISNLLQTRSFIVPCNQRKYVWNQNNWRELIEDIALLYQDKEREHFIGSIVLKTETRNDGINDHFSIIDGQQRVLTITMLFASIGYVYAKKKMFNKFKGLKPFLIVTDNEGRDHPIISEEANEDINKIVVSLYSAVEKSEEQGKEIAEINDILAGVKTKNIKDCVSFFVSELIKVAVDDKTLDRYRDILVGIRYIEVKATTDEDAYSIFEVLNARGQDLSDFDLLRNFLFKYSRPQERDSIILDLSKIDLLLTDKVELYLKHYVMHRYGLRTDKGDSRPYKVIYNQEKGNNVLSFLADLVKKAEYYHKIISCTNCSLLEGKVFWFFRAHRQQQFRPLILGLMHQLELNALSQADYEEIIEYLYQFFICYNVIGEQTSNKIDDIVDTYSMQIENQFSLVVLEKMKKSLCKRLPNEHNFVNSFKALAYSNHWKSFSSSKKRDNVMAILEYYEGILGNTVLIESATFNVEHCLPDSASEDNAVIGNLMLLEKSINDDVGSMPLNQKALEYKKSVLKEPINVAKLVENGKFDVNDRAEKMAKTIYNSFVAILNE